MAMASSMDALGAFSHLQTNLPAWITRVSELADHTAAKHAEYSEAYRRHASYKPRRRKNSSVCSIHTDDLVPLSERKEPPAEAVQKAAPETRDTPTPNQQAGRKRGTDEAPSIDSGDRHTFVSTRHNVIIEYDGHTQTTLEQIVKDIGIARNNIRRGKMGMMPRMGLRAGLFNRTAAITGNAAGGGEPSALSSLACVRSTRTGAGIVGVTGSTPGIRKESPFDYADKQLELAHGLCETAAYQVLRSGDCGTELDGVEEKFKMLLDMANNEVARLEEEKRKQEEEQARSQSEPQTESPQAEDDAAKPPPNPAAARIARIAAISAGAKDKSSTSDTPGAIEVDDTSSISAESIDLSAFRASRIRV
ncbi:hypothetical protein N7532_005275 [Penicillium argentinense]|uniref:Uncharacterized protein n=1 Tax=Penicillium argentinense TaxID=1131581 RepID=A0A9W9FDR5_9EURO|nr:uncharacterized protein N7532_005275 [Penicillium argentinense]KAJ5098274.1 hypothetical protein N7532_005275 [Penicillium argentinense]